MIGKSRVLGSSAISCTLAKSGDPEIIRQAEQQSGIIHWFEYDERMRAIETVKAIGDTVEI